MFKERRGAGILISEARNKTKQTNTGKSTIQGSKDSMGILGKGRFTRKQAPLKLIVSTLNLNVCLLKGKIPAPSPHTLATFSTHHGFWT